MAFREKLDATRKEAWEALLDGDDDSDEENAPAPIYTAIFKDLLRQDGNTAPEAARRIDAIYVEEFLPSDPLLKFQDDKGMEGFLHVLYQLIFDLARVIRYGDPKQDRPAQLLSELHQLPPKKFTIWKVGSGGRMLLRFFLMERAQSDCLVYTNEPIFPSVMEDEWNGDQGKL